MWTVCAGWIWMFPTVASCCRDCFTVCRPPRRTSARRCPWQRGNLPIFFRAWKGTSRWTAGCCAPFSVSRPWCAGSWCTEPAAAPMSWPLRWMRRSAAACARRGTNCYGASGKSSLRRRCWCSRESPWTIPAFPSRSMRGRQKRCLSGAWRSCWMRFMKAASGPSGRASWGTTSVRPLRRPGIACAARSRCRKRSIRPRRTAMPCAGAGDLITANLYRMEKGRRPSWRRKTILSGEHPGGADCLGSSAHAAAERSKIL